MRNFIIVCAVLASGSGCTNHYLRRSIVSQASTLTELQYQQVLGNLAMISLDPWALPAHASLKDGSAQIQDAGVANLVAFTNGSQTLPGLTGSRTVVEQWGVQPVTEKVELQLMRVAYRRALGYEDWLNVKLANDIAHEFCGQISNSDDIDLNRDPTTNKQVLEARIAPGAGVYSQRLKAAYDQLDAAPDQLAADQITKSIKSLKDSWTRVFVADVHDVAEQLKKTTVNSNDETLISKHDNFANLDLSLVEIDNPAYDRNYNSKVPDFDAKNIRAIETIKLSPSPVTREARRKVKDIIEDIDSIPSGWFAVGYKKDIPPNARYVGRFRDRYAWVCPGEGCMELAEFTAKILDFSTLIKDQTVLTVPGGPRFTPSGNR